MGSPISLPVSIGQNNWGQSKAIFLQHRKCGAIREVVALCW